ncbi:MAG: anthranilate synthase component II [Candidatus Dormibacteria bacterium]
MNAEFTLPDRPLEDSVLVVDSYDSFTFNLVQYLGELGARTVVVRNDQASVAEVDSHNPAAIVLSPGPGTPADAGIIVPLVRELGARVPILGVCLGLQAIAAAYGGDVVRAPELMHGKLSPIHHRGIGLFAGLDSPFLATRYHSLMVDADTLPPDLEVTAWTEAGVVMGLRHRSRCVEGVQFHPESIGTTVGRHLLAAFLQSVAVPLRAGVT